MPRKQRQDEQHAGDQVADVPLRHKQLSREPESALDPEREQDAWDEFAADYYEIVEQLPLELHRNFALLRELDDQTQHHTANLLTQLRNYISRRLPALGPPSTTQTWPDKPPPAPEVLDIGIPESDGHGGLVVPRAESLANGKGELKSTTEPQSRGFPTRDPQLSPKRREQEPSPRKHAHELLPEVAKLSREMLRGAEEKVALAQGAYNTIDRHIRSLDSALVNSESSLQLGMRPLTHPSSTIEPPVASTSTLPQADPSEITIGLGGGGGSRKKGRNNKKRGRHDLDLVQVPTQGHGPFSSAVAVTGGIVPAAFDLAVDPNEPRYCYCQQVSYGEMIGCENEECPLEWFHLACAGLAVAPTGKWWCDICRPKLGKSAAQRKR